MKRFFSLFLALTLVLALSVPAFAADYSYSYKDGKITGSISASGTNPETWVNGVLMGGKDLNISVSSGTYEIKAYMDGKLLGTQTINTAGSSVENNYSVDVRKITLSGGVAGGTAKIDLGGGNQPIDVYARVEIAVKNESGVTD